MSYVETVELDDESLWTYVAAAMAEGIREGGLSSVAPFAAVPAGVYEEAQEFFRSVAEAIDSHDGSHIPSDSVASASRYLIAIRALRGIESDHEAAYNDRLRRFVAIMGRDGDAPEPGELAELAAFFDRIAERGETRAYERFMSGCGGW